MNIHTEKNQGKQLKAAADSVYGKQNDGNTGLKVEDNRPEAIWQRKLQEIANNSPQVKQLMAYQQMADSNARHSPVIQLSDGTASNQADTTNNDQQNDEDDQEQGEEEEENGDEEEEDGDDDNQDDDEENQGEEEEENDDDQDDDDTQEEEVKSRGGWISEIDGFIRRTVNQTNLSQSVDAMLSGDLTGRTSLQFGGHPVFHFSRGQMGANTGVSLFYTYPHGTADRSQLARPTLIGVGWHNANRSYLLDWGIGTAPWTRGETIQLR